MDKMKDEERSTTKNAEQIIEDLGGCGKYQMRMSIAAHLTKMSICWSLMSFIIVSKTTDFWCASDVNSNVTYIAELNNTEYDAKKACVSIDGTKCTKFRFDDSLRTIMSDFDLVCDYDFTASTIMSIQNAGSVAGSLIMGHIADLIGRKIPLFSSFLVVTVAGFASLGASGWVLIAVSRFIIGVASGAFLAFLYSLLSEFTLARHRTWVVGFPSWLLETPAFCLLAWLVHDWRYMNLAAAIIGIPCLFAWRVIPESFRWYLAHGKREKAETVLETIATNNDKPWVDPKRLEEIAKEEETRKDQRYSIFDLFKTKQLIRVTVLLGIIWFGQSFIHNGINFGVRRLSGNIYLNVFLFNILGIPTKAVAIWTRNRFGRRATSLVCFGVTALACFGVGVVQNINTDLRGSLTNGLALTGYLLGSASWGPVQMMDVELYPAVVRNIGFGTMTIIGSIGTILSPQFDYLGDVQGVPGLMYFACGVAAVLSFLSLFGLTETKDAYLDDTIPGTKREQSSSSQSHVIP